MFLQAPQARTKKLWEFRERNLEKLIQIEGLLVMDFCGARYPIILVVVSYLVDFCDALHWGSAFEISIALLLRGTHTHKFQHSNHGCALESIH